MCVSVGSYVITDQITLIVDAEGVSRGRSGTVDAFERAAAFNEAMLHSILVVVEADDVSPYIRAVDPVKGGVGKVDRRERSPRQQESVETKVWVNVRTDNVPVACDDGGEGAHSAWDVEEGKCVVAEPIAMRVKEVALDEFRSHHIPAVVDAPASQAHRGIREINYRERTAAEHVGMLFERVAVSPNDCPARV